MMKEYMSSVLVKNVDTKLRIQVCGSFRRGKKESGDIDVLIASSSKSSRTRFIERLVSAGILVEELAKGRKKYMGIGVLPDGSMYRRIDIIETTLEEFPFAQLYFTGSKDFSRR